MRTFVIGLAVLSLTTTAALTQEPAKLQFLAAMPANAATVANWYKQSVYDPSENKVGEIRDVLVEKKDGKIVAFIIGVGGFLGAGEKDVAVPFNGVYTTAKGNDLRLVRTS
jgi:sporulation protein YlmC with PRC-barrel domain